GVYAFEGLSGRKPPRARDPRKEHLLDNVDWDPALSIANRWHDRVVSVMHQNDRGARDKQLGEIEDELKAMKEELGGAETLADILQGKEPPKVLGKAVGNIMVCLMFPASRKIQQAADRTEQLHANLHIAFALAGYQRENGSYPAKLEALAP